MMSISSSLTLDLVKRLAAKHMPEFLTSDVLAQLTEAGILSSSIVKTLTLSPGIPKCQASIN